MDMTRLLSRTPGRDADKRNSRDEWGKTHGSGIWLTGRTVLNMWRLMRSELKLCSYTLQVSVLKTEKAAAGFFLVTGGVYGGGGRKAAADCRGGQDG